MDQESKSSFALGKALKQQVLKAWQPVPTINSTIILFGILSVYFLSMGIVLNVYSDRILQQSFRYDAYCLGDETCYFPFALDADYIAPVYIYYQLDNFFQNQRRYITSKNVDQLSGQQGLTVDDLQSCYPVITNGQMGKIQSITGQPLDASAPAIPCGLIAQSIFNDSFILKPLNQTTPTNYSQINITNITSIDISSNGIAWPSDLQLYSNTNIDQQWLNITDERFIVWMRVAAMPNFRKLWGVIDLDLTKGKYLLQISNNYNSSYYGGKKYIVFSTTNPFGGKNQFLAVAYIFVGVVSTLVTLGFVLKKCFSTDQKRK